MLGRQMQTSSCGMKVFACMYEKNVRAHTDYSSHAPQGKDCRFLCYLFRWVFNLQQQ